MKRATLERAVRVGGEGLFTGRPASVEIIPVDSGGITFESGGRRFSLSVDRIDDRPAHPAFSRMPPRSTSVSAGAGFPPIHTVEHLLAALAGLGVTDALVRVEGGEVPIGDGSAALFIEPMVTAGLRPLGSRVEPITVAEPVVVESDGASVLIEPADAPSFEYLLDYGAGSPIEPGRASWDGSPGSFARDIAPARTFCLVEEAEALHAMGLFEHLTPREMLVFGAAGPIENGLRLPDEPARHKLLDMVGDLALVGRPLCARVVGTRSGHALNREAARRIARALE